MMNFGLGYVRVVLIPVLKVYTLRLVVSKILIFIMPSFFIVHGNVNDSTIDVSPDATSSWVNITLEFMTVTERLAGYVELGNHYLLLLDTLCRL